MSRKPLDVPTVVASDPGATRSGAEPVSGPSRLDARFVDEGELGRGGMAVVHRVRDRSLRRTVAIKRMSPDLASEPRETERFIEEAQITGQLDHPNIVPIHELGIDDAGSPYFVMRLVSGHTLARELDLHGVPRPPGVLDYLLEIMLKVCDAVAFAHSKGVVHRDLKPQNVMVGTFGQVYLMDWGLARIVREDAPVTTGHSASVAASNDASGTVWYMAPEQAKPEFGPIDERTDVFGLGAILYEMLTGRPPHDGGSPIEVRLAAFECRVVPPEQIVPGGLVPPVLARIALKALARRPEDRYQTALDLRRELERFMRGGGRFETRTIGEGELVVREGDEGREAYVISAGRCIAFKSIDGHKVVLREMGPGDVFGETAVFSAKPRTASVEALEPLTVIVVTRDSIAESLGLNTWMGAFVRALADRFRDLDEKLAQHERVRRASERGDRLALLTGRTARRRAPTRRSRTRRAPRSRAGPTAVAGSLLRPGTDRRRRG
jgi:serine/threonine-protein kinase